MNESQPELPMMLYPVIIGEHSPHVQKFLKFLPDTESAKGRSKDQSTQVGAVVLDPDYNLRISGYNGFPRGIDDAIESRHRRPEKYLWTAHAEENCIAQAARIGVSLKGCTILLTSLFPCATCARLIIQSGIMRVIAPRYNVQGYDASTRVNWDEVSKVSFEMLSEAGVQVFYYEFRSDGPQS